VVGRLSARQPEEELFEARGLGDERGDADACLPQRDRSARNEIVAPRIVPYVMTLRRNWDGGALDTPEQARKFAQYAKQKGMAGLKVFAGGDNIFDPEILSALLDEDVGFPLPDELRRELALAEAQN